jgi:tRNA threonylcarbamoyladenosine biosynthesis protein TsaE
MPQSDTCLFLPDDAATTRLGATLAALVRPGDTLLLHGPVGAGKSYLSRALIQSLLGRAEDVPSPTFTLVQTYETLKGEVWHADLYRLSQRDELTELGLEGALGRAICLVEWPERLGPLAPADALHLHLAPQGEGRALRMTGGRAGLVAAVAQAFGAGVGDD